MSRIKVFTATALAALLTATLALPASASTPSVQGARISGQDRLQTSESIAFLRYRGQPNPSTLYIARADVAADALAAGTLTDGPVILVDRGGNNAHVMRWVNEKRPSQVIALGGEAAIPSSVLTSIAKGAATSRLAGNDRIETSLVIARRAFPGGSPTIYFADGFGADGQGSPDAVSGGSLTDGPIILVQPGVSHPGVNAYVSENSRAQRIQLGARQLGVSVSSVLGGADRYETSALIAKRAFPNGFTSAYLARGDVFADAISAGCFTDGPILLTYPWDVPAPTLNALKAGGPSRVFALGGVQAVSAGVLKKATESTPGGQAEAKKKAEEEAKKRQIANTPRPTDAVMSQMMKEDIEGTWAFSASPVWRGISSSDFTRGQAKHQSAQTAGLPVYDPSLDSVAASLYRPHPEAPESLSKHRPVEVHGDYLLMEGPYGAGTEVATMSDNDKFFIHGWVERYGQGHGAFRGRPNGTPHVGFETTTLMPGTGGYSRTQAYIGALVGQTIPVLDKDMRITSLTYGYYVEWHTKGALTKIEAKPYTTIYVVKMTGIGPDGVERVINPNQITGEAR